MSGEFIDPGLIPPRLAPIGYIKIGEKGPARKTSDGKGTWNPPQKLDHFRVTGRMRGADENLIRDDAVHAAVGDKPTELDFTLPFDTPGENMRARMQEYRGRTCIVTCNGVERIDAESGVAGPCPRAGGKVCKCKPSIRLDVMLKASPTFGGVHMFRSTSWETVNNIQTTLRLFYSQLGTLRGLPLRLVVYPAEVSFQVGNETKTGTAYKVAVVLAVPYVEAAQIAAEHHRTTQIARQEIRRLSAAWSNDAGAIDAEDEGDIGDEFFPRAGVDRGTRELNATGDLNRALLGAGPAADPEPEPEPSAAPVAGPAGDVFDELETWRNTAVSRNLLTDEQDASAKAIVAARDDPERAGAAIDRILALVTGSGAS